MFFSSPSSPPLSTAAGQAKPAMIFDFRRSGNTGSLFPTSPLSAAVGGRLADEEWVAVCPEQLGGLSTPRSAARIEHGSGIDVLAGRARVKTLDGVDVTWAYVRGAEAVLEIARRLEVTTCFLKDRSPSCGINSIQNETDYFQGPGVCAALLIQKGFETVEIKAKAGTVFSV